MLKGIDFFINQADKFQSGLLDKAEIKGELKAPLIEYKEVGVLREIDYSNWLFRCSALSKLMTEPKSKIEYNYFLNNIGISSQKFNRLIDANKFAGLRSEVIKSTVKENQLAVGTETYLKELNREMTWMRRKEYGSKHLEKGIIQENQGIKLINRILGTSFKKNTQRLYNEFVTGEPDVFEGEIITETEHGYDVKCSWDASTFPYDGEPLDKNYYYQNIGYMWLTGAKKWTTIYCLVNCTADQIKGEKLKVYYKMNEQLNKQESQAYIDACIEIEKNMIFNMSEFLQENFYFDFHCKDWKYDLPLHKRVMQFPVEYSQIEVERIKEQAIKSRIFLNSLKTAA